VEGEKNRKGGQVQARKAQVSGLTSGSRGGSDGPRWEKRGLVNGGEGEWSSLQACLGGKKGGKGSYY